MQTENIRAIRIATRRSKLALWQAEYVGALLRSRFPGITVHLVPIVTKGDRILHTPLNKIGGKGLFIKELEQAMAAGTADIAVHSMKDVGADLPPGYDIAAVLKRENPLDAFVSRDYACLEDLPPGAKIGTCSLRRRMQIARLYPELVPVDLRGNVPTRLAKLDEGEFAAIILACAGLIRLDLAARITKQISPEIILPAVGQGAIGIECRTDSPVYPLAAQLNDEETALCVHTERIISKRLNASCQVPLAAFAQPAGRQLHLKACIGQPQGENYIAAKGSSTAADARQLGEKVAQSLIDQGGRDILAALQHD